MFVINDSNARDRACLATIATIIDLARNELPEVATLALGAYTNAFDDGGRELLERAYRVAVDAKHEYLAELLEHALHQAEHVKSTR